MKRMLLTSAALICTLATMIGCRAPGYNLPTQQQLMAPGPGVAGPGPGVMQASAAASAGFESEGIIGVGGVGGMGPTVQVMFAKPEGMQVTWDADGSGAFSSSPLVAPGRTNFRQAGLYRLKLTNIPGQEGFELYPTLEVGPPTPRTMAYLAHNAVPLQLTVDDFNQIAAGNFVTKVIYLPDPEFQELAVAGVETLVSTRLDPGVDPITEADRRGSILGILRVGNKDIEMPGMQGEILSYQGSLGDAGVAQAGFHSLGKPGEAVYGMPFTGTPIGLPGPPHIPLGSPAGLQQHIMRNHTHTYVPDPSNKIRINVKQMPGMSYPAPRDRAWIKEYNHPDCIHTGS